MTDRTKFFSIILFTGGIAALLYSNKKIQLKVRVIESSETGITGKVEYQLTVLNKVVKGTINLNGSPIAFEQVNDNYRLSIVSNVGNDSFANDDSLPLVFTVTDTRTNDVVLGYSIAAVPELLNKWITV